MDLYLKYSELKLYQSLKILYQTELVSSVYHFQIMLTPFAIPGSDSEEYF
jgi:hypothetical protein